ncbi:MAG: single-stranded-DNA-specific exonuclease RecJ [Dethiobacteria bacterium]|jgi:single-stranded-DNA-specific exonuclease RecJ
MARKKQSLSRIWQLSPQESEKCALLSREFKIPLPVAQILLNRGISSVEEGEAFLHPDLTQLYSPFSMQDMDRAVEIIFSSLRQGKRIAVYGDYDVDGITATALLFSLLQGLGGDVVFYLPCRLQEGYGLNCGALDFLQGQGVSLLITVDCGISNVAEISYACKLGLEVIVTDHHQPGEILPAASAVLNPWRRDCSYPFQALCGVGVAFKLGQALCYQAGKKERIRDYLDLVALGTVADLVPLHDENRILVAHGLQQMEQALRPGLQAIRAAAGVKNKRLTTDEIAFIIAPRLNAAGRMGDAARALHLLLEEEKEKASQMAQELQKENSRRQALELKIFKEACTLVTESPPEKVGRSFLLLAREDWHPGVLGIVASRMVERFNLPVILMALENGIGQGSGRSCGDFDLAAALKQCSALLLGFGGHRQAAGLKVAEECIPLLREKLDILAGDFYGEQGPTATLYLDALLEPEEITPELVRTLQLLEPFGHGNPSPLFWGKKWLLEKRREVGKDRRHLQLGVQKKGMSFAGISFNGKTRLPPLTLQREIDLAFSVSFDLWRGNETLQLEILDCTYADEYRGKNSLTLVDRRGLKKKMLYIKDLWEQSKGILIFVNTAGRRQQLEKVFAGMPEISFSHQGAWPPGGFNEIPDHFVLYDLPLSDKKLKRLLARLTGVGRGEEGLQIHLLYGHQDYRENFKLLRATVPDFCSLEQVYYYLQGSIETEKNVYWDRICYKLQRVLPFPATKHLLKKSMEIFAEALYLELNEQDILFQRRVHDYCSLLKDLAGTQAFRLERDKWKHTLSWQQFLLDSAGKKILNFLSDFTPYGT